MLCAGLSPLRFAGEKGGAPGRLTGFQGVYGANSTFAQNGRYVNPFVRGTPTPTGLRFSSTVGGPRPVTRIVGKPAPVASEFDWIPSPCSDGFRFGV